MTNNEVIAQFMGWGNTQFQVYEYKEKETVWFRPNTEPFKESYLTTNELEFHTSWVWLMEVIEKIESLGYDTGICGIVIKGEKLTEVLFSPQIKNNKIEIHVRDSKPKIEVVYQAVVDFIKCYSV